MLKIDKPIMSAPMGGAAGPQLVAAVSNAGGFGVLPLWGKPVDDVHEGIAAVRALTDRNFGVNLNLSFPFEEALEACIQDGVFAVSLFWGSSPAAIRAARAGGLVVMVSVGTAEEAVAAADAGADVIVAQGWEAGGHVWGTVATMALVPAVVDAVTVPVVAAGGIADGRGLAAAMMLGASGAWIGTRFLASVEASIHDEYRRAILGATEAQTGWFADLYDVAWPNAPHRALVNSTSRRWEEEGALPPGSRPQEDEVIGHRPSGQAVVRYQSYTPLSGTTGTVEAMSLWAGQGVSLVREVLPAARIIDEIIAEATAVIRSGHATLADG